MNQDDALRDAFSLEGRVAVVTGAARGIGRAIAIELAVAGATVACADREPANETVAAITVQGARAWSSQVDVSSQSAVNRLIDETVERAGALDIAVHNAGVYSAAPALEETADHVDAMNAVNFHGVLFGCQAAARAMIAQGSGTIINVASSAIDSSVPGNLAYSASKAAMRQLTRVLAREWGEHGVRVNAVAPGWIETELTRKGNMSGPDSSNPESLERKRRSVAARRALPVEGEPEYVAHAVRFLASDAARWITGQALRVDGGLAMAW